MRDALFAFLVLLAVAGSWYSWRVIHYEVGYESMVEQTVRAMVKPEYLKKEYRH